MNLFDDSRTTFDIPLSLRMRPLALDDFLGQEKIAGEGTVLRRAIQEDKLHSLIFWGPPGCGKTTLAHIIAQTTKAVFFSLSAVTSSIADIRKVIEEAAMKKRAYGERTILLIDEIHRFNKAQQDALLPALEEGIIVLIGITTENPLFEVNPPLVSRSRIIQFETLSDEDIRVILNRAFTDKEKGLGELKVDFDKAALDHIINISAGDARSALNALELAVLTTSPDEKGVRYITLRIAEEAIQKRALAYDKEAHYDVISAFIKSLRGSDPDASLYWLARMIYAGEDPKFIARRMVIFASEDIGNADPQALVVAVAAAQAVQFVGLPECRLNLAQAAIYLATAPKSNSIIKGINHALSDVEKERAYGVPRHICGSNYPGAKRIGAGEGYKYPHDFPGHVIEQDYLPPELKGKVYYRPSDEGCEKKIAERLEE
ncbi:MAG: replication-associated recombination protein A, partial [Candidatus Subteraquimicrobiales bacterium]|nr:replication-associated recombination protein A [Candidatus Subteraquimicrobiales bacterium]